MVQVNRVISIGAHSLDAEILGGPLILKYANEDAHCTFAHMTQGRLEDPNATASENEAYLEQVFQQNKRAASRMNADVHRFGYLSHEMPPVDALTDDIEEYLARENADLVITHWRGSMHQRHINTHDAVTNAVKRLRAQGSAVRLVYGENFEDLVGFIPQAYFTLSHAEVEQWFTALREYAVFRGEVNDFPYFPYYSNQGKVRQIESGTAKHTVAYMYASMVESFVW